MNDQIPPETPDTTPPQFDRITPAFIEGEMKKSYVTYAMSVIVSRALPDVRDGLKPVHRRVLYGMEDLSLHPGKPYKKSARIVGDVIGKYHPHGDSAVYQTLVRMAQDFSLRYPLIDGQGNFGSIDGDSPAAMRYTEARMHQFSKLMLEDLEKETVDFSPNYDESLSEPNVLPAAFPNLLVNGTTGIAVGMATSMPPHNLREIINATQALITNPNLPDEDLLNLVSGPDFPTGGIIHGRSGIRLAYLKGKGKVLVRSKCTIELNEKSKDRILVHEIPYQVNKSNLIEKIADLVKQKTIEGISDIRDESDRHGIRIVIELKRDALPEIVLNQLFKYSQLQQTFSINNLALVDGKPKVLTLRELITEYIKHRHVIIVRRTQFDLKKAEERAHILEGLRIALNNLDEVIKTIRASATTEEARNQLQEKFSLSEKQSLAIVEMRLRALTGLEIEKIEAEYRELTLQISDLKDILANQERRYKIISDELEVIKEKFGDERRTLIEDAADEVTHLDLIADEPMVITVSHRGYIKRVPTDVYRSQGRGGRGISAGSLVEEDFVEHLFVGWAHSYVLIFTNLGRCHWIRVYEIPEASRTSKGKALINYLSLQPGETVRAFVPIKEFTDNEYIVFATAHGLINKMALTDFGRPRNNGIYAINLMEGDHLVSVLHTTDDKELIIGSKHGQAIRFSMDSFRTTGRGTRGVRGMSLGEEDHVIGMIAISNTHDILTVTEKGYAKKTPPAEYRLTGRGAKGVRNIKITDKNGSAVCIAAVKENDQLMILSRNGVIIKISANSISQLGRDTQGVRAIRLDEGDVVADVEIVADDSQVPTETAVPIGDTSGLLTDSDDEAGNLLIDTEEEKDEGNLPN